MPLKPPLKKPLVLSKGLPLKSPSLKPPIVQKTPIGGKSEKDDEGTKTTSVSIRLSKSHKEMLAVIKDLGECDQSEAIKRGIRLLYKAYTAHDAKLVVADSGEQPETQFIKRNGVLC